MKKRILAALLSAAMVIGMLSGCAASGSSSGGDDKNAEDGDKVKLSFLNKYPKIRMHSILKMLWKHLKKKIRILILRWKMCLMKL